MALTPNSSSPESPPPFRQRKLLPRDIARPTVENPDMNITCHYYYFVDPLVEEYRDDNQATPPIDRIFVHSPARTYEVAFFGTASRIFMFRISVPNLAAEELAAADLNMAQVLK